MITVIKENEKVLGNVVRDSIKRYFENSEHRRAFEKWYLINYGKPYKWKGENINEPHD